MLMRWFLEKMKRSKECELVAMQEDEKRRSLIIDNETQYQVHKGGVALSSVM